MQKQIVCISTLFYTIISYAAQTPIPHIVYNTKNSLHALEAKLTEKFSPQSKCPKIDDALSHQSPEVTRIHSRDYLNNLDQCPSTMLAAINNNFAMALYPNRYSRTYLPFMLDNVSTTFAATESVIAMNNLTQCKPNYAISLAESYSFAGHNQGNNGDVYAPIPIASAYALEEHKDTIQHILIIDENITTNTAEYYFSNGNGSIFFPKNNTELSTLFNNKIIIQNQIPDGLWDFLHNPDNTIDLAFYNINIDDVEPINGIKPEDAKERILKIWSLLSHSIPTIFILSGDKINHEKATFSLIKYIDKAARKIATPKSTDEILQSYIKPLSDLSSLSSDEIDQEWEQIKQEIIKAQLEAGIQRIDKFMDYLKNKCHFPIPTEPLTNDSLNHSNYSQSSSESCSDLEQERRRLKKQLEYDYSSSKSESDYEAAETSSTDEQ